MVGKKKYQNIVAPQAKENFLKLTNETRSQDLYSSYNQVMNSLKFLVPLCPEPPLSEPLPGWKLEKLLDLTFQASLYSSTSTFTCKLCASIQTTDIFLIKFESGGYFKILILSFHFQLSLNLLSEATMFQVKLCGCVVEFLK